MMYLDNHIENWFNANHMKAPKKLGRRKVVTVNRTERRRQMALYRYSRKKKDLVGMQDCIDKIKELYPLNVLQTCQ